MEIVIVAAIYGAAALLIFTGGLAGGYYLGTRVAERQAYCFSVVDHLDSYSQDEHVERINAARQRAEGLREQRRRRARLAVERMKREGSA